MKRKVLESMTQFAFKLHDALCETIEKEENVIFSPASIYAALAMTCCGARGTTAEELMMVLGIPDNENFHQAFSKIWDGIHKAQNDPKCDLNVVNRLWLQNGFPVEEEFTANLGEYYKSDIGDVDFLSSPTTAIRSINEWVEGKTRNLIKDAADENSVSSDTKLLITNAIYFRGEWLNRFSWCRTKELPFHINKGESCQVHMMYQKNSFGYLVDKAYDCQILVAKYENSSLRMLIILPNKIDGLADLEEQLRTAGIEDDVFDHWMCPGTQLVEVYLPKFEFSGKYDLKGALQGVGVTDLFTSCADLGGISKEAAYVASFSHQAFIQVNEEGTEACALTSSTLRTSSISSIPLFKADRPFTFVIIDSDTSLILFWGRYCKPI